LFFFFYGRLGFGKSQIDLESSESVGLWQVSDRLGVIRSFVVWYVLSGSGLVCFQATWQVGMSFVTWLFVFDVFSLGNVGMDVNSSVCFIPSATLPTWAS
jgi:hypothetical protein